MFTYVVACVRLCSLCLLNYSAVWLFSELWSSQDQEREGEREKRRTTWRDELLIPLYRLWWQFFSYMPHIWWQDSSMFWHNSTFQSSGLLVSSVFCWVVWFSLFSISTGLENYRFVKLCSPVNALEYIHVHILAIYLIESYCVLQKCLCEGM